MIPLLYTIKESYVGEREIIEEINCRQPVTVYWCNSPANVFISRMIHKSRVVQMRKITIVNNNCLVHKKPLVEKGIM